MLRLVNILSLLLLSHWVCGSYSPGGTRWADRGTPFHFLFARLHPYLAHSSWVRLASQLMNTLTLSSRPMGSSLLLIHSQASSSVYCSKRRPSSAVFGAWITHRREGQDGRHRDSSPSRVKSPPRKREMWSSSQAFFGSQICRSHSVAAK